MVSWRGLDHNRWANIYCVQHAQLDIQLTCLPLKLVSTALQSKETCPKKCVWWRRAPKPNKTKPSQTDTQVYNTLQFFSTHFSLEFHNYSGQEWVCCWTLCSYSRCFLLSGWVVPGFAQLSLHSFSLFTEKAFLRPEETVPLIIYSAPLTNHIQFIWSIWYISVVKRKGAFRLCSFQHKEFHISLLKKKKKRRMWSSGVGLTHLTDKWVWIITENRKDRNKR